MKRLNNKGFAITTIVYGLAIMSTMILTLVMSMLATTRRDNSNLSNVIEQELIRFSKTSVIYEPSEKEQEFIVPEGEAGWYRIELWGAQGGGANGGLGAYTSGIIKLEDGDKLYFFIGKQGTDTTGGGATDVRLEGLHSPSSQETRIMVAAGGGKNPGADGGTLVGYNATMVSQGGKFDIKNTYKLNEGTTLLGYTVSESGTSMTGFEVRQEGIPKANTNPSNPGGEGYITSTNENYGGVSFISGYVGGKAFVKGVLINDAKYTYYKKTGASYATEGRAFYFVDAMMIPGVKAGAGQAKIERVVSAETNTKLPRLNEKLNGVQRVRDCMANTNTRKNIKSIAVAVNGSTMTGALTDDSSVSGYTCKVLNLSGTYDVDEVAVYHDPGYDYKKHTIEVYSGGGWKKIKNATSYEISETETATGFHISAYQPDFTVGIPQTGNYYIMPVTAEGKVISGFASSDDRANPLQINHLIGEVRQKWSIELLQGKLAKPGIAEYKIVELTRYNALTIYKDENMEGNQLVVSSFNNLARNEPSIWKILPMGDGTVIITSSAPPFSNSRVTGNLYAQTNSEMIDNYNTLVIGFNESSTQRFKLVKLDY